MIRGCKQRRELRTTAPAPPPRFSILLVTRLVRRSERDSPFFATVVMDDLGESLQAREPGCR